MLATRKLQQLLFKEMASEWREWCVWRGAESWGDLPERQLGPREGSCVLSLNTEAVEAAGPSQNPTSQESPLDLIVGPSSRSQPVPCLTEHLAGVQEQGFLQERTRVILGVSGGL